MKKQYRIVPDEFCECPREFGLAEVWATSRDYHRKDKNWNTTTCLADVAKYLTAEGYVFYEGRNMIFAVTPATVATEFTSAEEATKCMEAEHDMYVAWREGECYRYVVYTEQTCSLGHDHEVEIDNCGGFYSYKEALDVVLEVIKEP